MNTRDIEYLWKRASNNPHHDTNWHDPVVIAFAESVAAHTLMNIDPSKFMSYQEAFEAGRLAERDKWMERAHTMILGEREACAKVCDAVAQQMDYEGEGPTGNIGWVIDCADAIRARGNT